MRNDDERKESKERFRLKKEAHGRRLYCCWSWVVSSRRLASSLLMCLIYACLLAQHSYLCQQQVYYIPLYKLAYFVSRTLGLAWLVERKQCGRLTSGRVSKGECERWNGVEEMAVGAVFARLRDLLLLLCECLTASFKLIIKGIEENLLANNFHFTSLAFNNHECMYLYII